MGHLHGLKIIMSDRIQVPMQGALPRAALVSSAESIERSLDLFA